MSNDRVPSYMSARRTPSELYGHDILVPRLSDFNQIPDYISSDRSSVDMYGHDIMAPPVIERTKTPRSDPNESPSIRSIKNSLQRGGGNSMDDPALDSADSRKEVARPPRAKSPVEIPRLPIESALQQNQNKDLRASSPAVTNWMTEPAATVIALTPRIPVTQLPEDVREAITRVNEVAQRKSFIFVDGRPQALLALFKLPQGPKSAEFAVALFQAIPAILTDGNRRKCGVIGMCQAVTDLLKKHFETDPGAAFTGCKALYYLTYGCLGNIERLKAAGGLELMEAIIKHPACNTRVLGKGRMASKEAQYVFEKLGGLD